MDGILSENRGLLSRRRRKAHTIWTALSCPDDSADSRQRRTKAWVKGLTCTRMNLIIQKDAEWARGSLTLYFRVVTKTDVADE